MRGFLRSIAFFLTVVTLFLTCSCGGDGAAIPSPQDGEVHITFLNVGQADCALIRTSEAVIVVDTGDAATNGAELSAYLRRAGIGRIDLLVLTHPHKDHIGGAPTLLREFDVAECLMTDLLEDSTVFRETVDALRQEGCKVTRANDEVLYEYGGLSLEVLSPFREFYATVNDAGAVLLLRYAGSACLFTADVSDALEKELMERYPDALDVDLLKVSHHGSSDATSTAFLSVLTPKFAVISCGAGNAYGFPHMEVLSRLSSAGVEVHRTDTEGNTSFRMKNGDLSILK